MKETTDADEDKDIVRGIYIYIENHSHGFPCSGLQSILLDQLSLWLLCGY